MTKNLSKKTTSAFILAMAMATSSITGFPVLQHNTTIVHAKETTYNYHIKIGSYKLINLKNTMGKARITCTAYEPETDGYAANISFNDTYLQIHGLCEGSIMATATLSDQRQIKIHVTVTSDIDNGALSNGMNTLYTVNQDGGKDTWTFKYGKNYMSLAGATDSTPFTHMYFHADSLYNNTDKEKKPDVKINFYNKKKKYIGYYQLSTQKGTTVNFTVPAKSYTLNGIDCGIGPEDIKTTSKKKLTAKKFQKDVHYWKLAKS